MISRPDRCVAAVVSYYSSFGALDSAAAAGFGLSAGAAFGSAATLRVSGATLTGGGLAVTAIGAGADADAPGDDRLADALERSDLPDASTGAFDGVALAGASFTVPDRVERDDVSGAATGSGVDMRAAAIGATAGAAVGAMTLDFAAFMFVAPVFDGATAGVNAVVGDVVASVDGAAADGIVAVGRCDASAGCDAPGIRCNGSNITKAPAATAARVTTIAAPNGEDERRSEATVPPTR